MPKEYIIMSKKQTRLAEKLLKAKKKGVIDASDAAIAALFGVSQSKISHIRHGHNPKTPLSIKPSGKRERIPAKIVSKINALADEGKSILEIRDAAKVSYSTAQRYRKAHLDAKKQAA